MPATAAARAAPPSLGGSMAMTGTSTGSAPSRPRARLSSEAWVRVRVTTIRRPSSGRSSNHRSSVPATRPTTITDGDSSGWSPRVARVARVVTWSGRVPHRMAAAGVSGGSPPASSRSAIRGQRATPMSTTRVPPRRAAASQSMVPSPADGSSWPVMTVKAVDEKRWVTGMPA